ncbi:Nucleolar GTP-binding protein 1 [Thelohanellus kitauei]|uniref:Nucleolar GTP-binding protein 1 n=1 Tax=Thelohanellus kitauei TaxID=669202 RepID=A0A0C2MBC5_THEKT|nr:Nucleolar GTP-binding protein 1 [Thelohanellus kitauei]
MDIATCRSIPSVPLCKELIDSTLSKTQRKTPTEIHKNYDIQKIRSFYMRKVKFTQQNFHDKLSQILESFPRIENIHPFYSDLFNVLYDKDHYKIALGKVNLSKSLIDNVAKEYVKLLKFGDSLFRCKTLKRIALGRMVKIIKKLEKTLAYLEEVRKHISRLPTIDPAGRTIILTGFPNVGKSSFLNKVSRADVEVEPYPFTTKSLYIGQTDYNYLRFQVIDTPGILDHPLDDRNTIEMQSITALAHLRATIIYFIDISELCGYSISDQIQLFENIKPLFQGKPVVFALNKVDVMPMDGLSQTNVDFLKKYSENYLMCPLSTLDGRGVTELLNSACDLLLVQREDKFTQSEKVQDSARLYVATPSQVNPNRLPFVPQKLIEDLAKNNKPTVVTQKQIADTMGKDYFYDERERYLINENEKYDIIPEILNGKNIADYVDSSIQQKMANLELEEKLREEAGFYNVPKWTENDIKAHLDREHITGLRMLKMDEHSIKKSTKVSLPHTVLARNEQFKSDIGKNAENTEEIEIIKVPEIDTYDDVYKNKLTQSGIDNKSLLKCKKIVKRSQIKSNLEGRAGPGDRHVYDFKPKHLNSGKRKGGKTQRR